jgi:hypothetical protein
MYLMIDIHQQVCEAYWCYCEAAAATTTNWRSSGLHCSCPLGQHSQRGNIVCDVIALL